LFGMETLAIGMTGELILTLYNLWKNFLN